MAEFFGIICFIVTGVFSGSAFFCGRSLARSRAIYLWIGIALGLVLLKAVLQQRPEWEVALFPFPAYAYLQGYWIYPVGLFLLGLGMTRLSRRRTRLYVGMFAAVIFVCSLWENISMIIQANGTSRQTADANHHCQQTTGYTCGPSSCVSLLSYCGVPATEGEMALLCRTRFEGTTVLDAFYGLQRKPRGSRYRVKIMDIDVAAFQKLNVPAYFGRGNHAVVMKYEDGRVTLQDPLATSRMQVGLEDVRDQIPGVVVVVLGPDQP